MSTLTLAMLEAAISKMEYSPPPPTEVKVGSFSRFKKSIEDAGHLITQKPQPHGSFSGIPITVSPLVPEHMAVMVQGNEVVGVINLDKASKGGIG